jgi:hypothetical protein
MTRIAWLAGALGLFAVVAPVHSAPAKYSVKTAATPAPMEVKEPLRKLLGNTSVQLFNAKGDLMAEVWLRKEVPAKAKAELPKGVANYRLVEPTTYLGAIRFPKEFSDYRQQKIKPGVYTMRLGLQPMDGNHMGTAPYNEFCLLVPADQDSSPDPLKNPKDLNKLSNKASGGDHPAVLLLFPNPKPGDAVELADKGGGHWVLAARAEVVAGDQKLPLGIGLTLVGHSSE